MRPKQIVAGAMLAAALGGAARAGPVDDLTASGFVVVKTTKVVGDFDGCDRDRKVPLKSGGVFTCASFGYMHAQNPTATLLKSKDGAHYKLVINDAVFDGAFS
jgi:hypothetical protein